MHRHETAGLKSPNSLQELARWCLLKAPEVSIADLGDIPAELFPALFLDAVSVQSLKTLKSLILTWPFPVLPLGIYVHQSQTVTPFFKVLLDGLDALLAQKVRHRRCKLQVVDFRPISEKFWHRWCGTPISSCAYGKVPADHGGSGKTHTSASLEVVLDVTFGFIVLPEQITYIVNWVRERTSVHLCCKKMTLYEEPVPASLLSMVTPECAQEVVVFFTWTMSTMKWLVSFSPLLGQMSNLQRLLFITRLGPNELMDQKLYAVLLASQLPRLQSLREFHLESPFFFKDRLGQIIRFLPKSLEALSITECLLPEEDLIELCQRLSFTQLKELSLRGTPLSPAGEFLPVLLESCASTLQELDLGACRLQDAHLEAILPGLKLCSQLRRLNLRGNRASMATLVHVLRHLAGLPHLIMEAYPAPQESYNALNTLNPRTFDVLCAELREVLRDLGKPRQIFIITHYSCHVCGLKVIYNSECIMKGGYTPDCLIKQISFGLTESETNKFTF